MAEWLHVSHPETGGQTRVPDGAGVRERYEALGWVVGDDPDDGAPFVPPKAVEQNEEDGWITLYHPKTQAVHRFPSHPEAVQGAYEAGWQASPPKTPDPSVPPIGTPEENESARLASQARLAAAEKPKRKTEPATPADDEKEVNHG